MQRERKNNKMPMPTGGIPPEAPSNKANWLRYIAIFVVFVLAAGVLTARLAVLQVNEVRTWQTRANGQQLQSSVIQPTRGTIYDSELRPMVESGAVWTVEVYPNVLNQLKKDDFDAPRIAARELARILELDEEELYKTFSDKDDQYEKVKDQIELPQYEAIRAMRKENGLGGAINLAESSKRYYLYDSLAATVLGFVGDDGNGLEGLEGEYEDVLGGVPGRLITARDSWGGEMTSDEDTLLYPATDGGSPVLTLHVDIQRSLEEHMQEAIDQYHPGEKATGIVMDVNTGAILAMATLPSYNPSDPHAVTDQMTLDKINEIQDEAERQAALGTASWQQWRNKAVTDPYEPGSVFKIITAAAAIDSGTYTMSSTFLCNGPYAVNSEVSYNCAYSPLTGSPAIHDVETLADAIIDSCNVSFVQMAQGLGPHVWYHYLNGFGLTEPTGVDLPGEPSQQAINNLVHSEDALVEIPTNLYSASFGQGNKYTAIQMITAVSAAVNGGRLMQPYIVDRVLDREGNIIQQNTPTVKRQVISAETSAQLAGVLEDLVNDTNSSGNYARVDGLHVGGKSGTSEKLDRLSEDGKTQFYISSFLGFAPANDPQVAVLIFLDEPQDAAGTYFGGRLAGPAVGLVLKDTARILGIATDTTDGSGNRSTVSVPGLGGKTVQQAASTLADKGLSYIHVGDGATVLAQFPAVGVQVPRSGHVILYTNEGELNRNLVMPNVVGLGAQSAINMLRDMGFNVLTAGAPDEKSGVTVEAQDVPENTELPMGTVVTLTMGGGIAME